MAETAQGEAAERGGDVHGEPGDGFAPLQVDKEHLAATGGKVRVVAINAGNANCAVGQAGLDAARAVCAAAGETFGCRAEEVFPSSTGVIGVPLPAEKVIAVLPAVKAELGAGERPLSAGGAGDFDDGPGGKDGGVCTGDGGGRDGRAARGAVLPEWAGSGDDLHPRLVGSRAAASWQPRATMLMYLMTDVEMDPAAMQRVLRRVVEVSFNRISVDGDTSTNDTLLMLASGQSGVRALDGDEEFEAALTQVATSLAKQVVADGEGVTHVVELRVRMGRRAMRMR